MEFIMNQANELKIYHIDPDSKMMPIFSTEYSACFDIRANFGPKFREITVYDKDNDKRKKYAYYNSIPDDYIFVLHPKERALIPTGIIFDIPYGFFVKLYSRSGLTLKSGLSVSNGTGIIDCDYVEQTYVILENKSDANIAIKHGERIAQGELCEMTRYVLNETSQKPEQKSDRNGGFGSTGRI